MSDLLLNRRSFVAGSSATVAVFLLSCEKKESQPETPAPESPPTTLEIIGPEEAITLAAVLDRLLPAVEEIGAPSAMDLNVMYYIDGQLREPDFASLRDLIKRGLRMVNATAQKYHGGSFHTRTPGLQDSVLSEFQHGGVKGLRFPQARFFSQLRAFALEGYWGQPKYGGNKDEQGWAWVDIHPHCSHIHDRCSE